MLAKSAWQAPILILIGKYASRHSHLASSMMSENEKLIIRIVNFILVLDNCSRQW